MAALTSIAPDLTHRVVILGLSGTGKSTLAAQLATGGFHLHWLDLEGGIDTLLKLPVEAQRNVDVYRIPDSASYPIAADTLMQLFKHGKMKMCDKHGKHNCTLCLKEGASFSSLSFSELGSNDIVVLDTATQLSHSILAHTMRNAPVDAKPERDDWGALRKYTEFFLSQFQACPVNLVVITHCIEAELEDSRKKLVPSFGSASMSAEFAKGFNDVIYCDVVNKKHKAFSSSTYSNTVLTRSRTDYLIESYDVPSLIPLFKNEHLTLAMKERVVAVEEKKEQGEAAVAALEQRLYDSMQKDMYSSSVKEVSVSAKEEAKTVAEVTQEIASAVEREMPVQEVKEEPVKLTRAQELLAKARAAAQGGIK